MIKKYFNEHEGAVITPWFSKNGGFVTGIRYDKSQGLLYVRIGRGNVYKYTVPITLADQFTRSANWGKFYNENIKNKHRPTYDSAIRSFISYLPAVEQMFMSPVKGPGIKPTTARAKLKQPPNISSSVSASNNATKDILGYVIGIADVGLMFAPPQVWIPARLALFAASPWLEKQGITEPIGFQFAAVGAAGYGVKAAFAGPASRLTSYAASYRTPFFNVGLKKGVLGGKATWGQIASGITFGGKAWQKALTAMEKRKVITRLVEPYKVPGTNLYKITADEMATLKITSGFELSRRSFGPAEKVLDMTVRHANKLPWVMSAAYMGVAEYDRYGQYKAAKKERKKKYQPESFIINITEQGIDVSSTILEIGYTFGQKAVRSLPRIL